MESITQEQFDIEAKAKFPEQYQLLYFQEQVVGHERLRRENGLHNKVDFEERRLEEMQGKLLALLGKQLSKETNLSPLK